MAKNHIKLMSLKSVAEFYFLRLRRTENSEQDRSGVLNADTCRSESGTSVKTACSSGKRF